MKAKEMYHKLRDCGMNEDLFNETLATIMTSLCEDAENLMRARNCKTNDAKISVITEVNNKYHALCNLLDKNRTCEFERLTDHIDLSRDGFKAVFVETHPDMEWYFDAKKFVREAQERREERKRAMDNFAPYKVTPYEELTMQNIHSEVLHCLSALGGYVDVGFNPEWLRPLANRVSLLRYWIEKGSIDVEESKEMEEDPIAFFKKVKWDPINGLADKRIPTEGEGK